jgi:hypothetical protein
LHIFTHPGDTKGDTNFAAEKQAASSLLRRILADAIVREYQLLNNKSRLDILFFHLSHSRLLTNKLIYAVLALVRHRLSSRYQAIGTNLYTVYLATQQIRKMKRRVDELYIFVRDVFRLSVIA